MGIIPILVSRAKGRVAAAVGERPFVVLAGGLLCLAAIGGGCAPGAGDAGGEPGTGVSVVASFAPLAEAAGTVGGDRVTVTNLTPPGVEPHDLELDPDQVSRIAEADLVLFLGDGFQPAVQEAVSSVAQGETVDVLEGLPRVRGTSEPEGSPSSGAADGLEAVAVDPHVWLDPVLMRRIVERTRQALTTVDPSGAGVFRRNAEALDARLARLDAEYERGLESCERRVIVTAHAAFGYLARRYGLTVLPISGLSPEAEPDPQRLAELAETVRRDGTTTIFTETLVSPRVAETLANEVGVATAVLDPLESLSGEKLDHGADYASVMRENLATLEEALGCE